MQEVTGHGGRHGSRFSLLRGTRAAQIVEFAVALPLLVVLVVGIFDFANAFNLKRKLDDAAREAARFASNQPSNDLSQATPSSIVAVSSLVGGFLLNSKVDDCGMSNTAGLTITHSSGTLAWTISSTNATCPGTMTLTVDRGNTYSVGPSTLYPSGLTIEDTEITISYPYKWQFNSVITLLVPSASYPGTTQLNTTAVMQNLN